MFTFHVALWSFAVPFSLVCAHFHYTSVQTTPFCTPSSEIVAPKSLSELEHLVAEAFKTGGAIKPLGARHSVTDIICTEGTPVSMENFKIMLMNQDGTATFGAGVTFGEAHSFLETNGRSLIQSPFYNGITIGKRYNRQLHD